MGFSSGSDIKESARDQGLIPELGGFPGEGNGNPLQYSCLKNSMDRGAWWTTVHGVPKSQTWLLERISFSPTNSTKDHLNVEQLPQNNFWTVAEDTRHPERQPNLFRRKVKLKSLSHVQLFVTPWTTACQASPSMEFFRQEYWSGLPFSSPGDLPNPGTKPGSPTLEADSLTSKPPGKPFQKEVGKI